MTEEQEIILKHITFPYKDYWLETNDIQIDPYYLFGKLCYIVTYKNINFEVFDNDMDEEVYKIYQDKELLECLNYFHLIFEDSSIRFEYDWNIVQKIKNLDYIVLFKTFDILTNCGILKIFYTADCIELLIKTKDEINEKIVFDFCDLDDNLISYLYDWACLIQKRIFYKKILK